MKKKYVVVDTAESTGLNGYRLNETIKYYFGKAIANGVESMWKEDSSWFDYCVENHGYDRLCDAKRKAKSVEKNAEFENSLGYWKHNPVQIVEFEVA